MATRKTESRLIISAQKRGERAFKDFTDQLGELGRRAKLAGIAAAAGLTALAARSAVSIDALAKTSDKLGIATEDLASLRYAAELTGVGTEKLDLGLQRMTRRIAEVALTGRGEAAPALETLGLRIEELAGLDPSAQFEKIAEAMGQVESQSARVALGFKLFDSEGVDLIRTLDKLEGEGFAAVRAEAEKLGLAVSRFDAARIEQANDAVRRLKFAAEGIGNVLAIEATPYVQALADAFLGAGLDAEKMGDYARAALDTIARGVGLVADAFYGWSLIFAGLELGIDRIQLAAARASEAVNSFFGTTDEALRRRAEQLEETFELQSRGMSAEQKALLRETFDQQIAALNISGAQTAELEAQYEASRKAYEELAKGEKPSERIARSLAEAREESDRLAASTAAAAAAGEGRAAAPTVAETPEQQRAREAAEREEERAREQLAANLEAVRQGTLSREELEREAIANRLEILRAARESDLLDEQRYYELAAEVAVAGQAKLAEAATEDGSARERRAVEIERLREEFLTREEVEREAIARRLELLRTAREDDLIDEQRYYELSAEVAAAGQARLTEIANDGASEREKFAAMSTKAQAAHVLGTLATLTAGAANENKKLFQLNKAAAIGNAVMFTAEGVARALKDFPVPINFIMAAAVAAAGLAQVSAIRSTQFGGGTTPSVAGSTPTVNGTPVQNVPTIDRDPARGGSRVEVFVNGSVVGMGGAEELVDFIQESLRDRIDNRDEIIYSSTSRQASV